jgi:predicted secreted Zn-dependent protease
MIPSMTGRRWAGRLLLMCALPVFGVSFLWLTAAAQERDSAPIVLASSTERGASPGGPAGDQPTDLAASAAPPDAPEEQPAAALRGGVRVSSSTSLYAVEGANTRSLLASLRQRGPSDGQGTWAASTAWMFHWSYRPVSDPDCHVASANVDLDLTLTFPEWATPPEAAPVVVTAWQGYLSRVELHERGHRDIAETAANDLARTLEGLPAQKSCDALATTARTTVSELLARHAQAQAAYDRETGHGASQGAVLHE